VTTKAPTGIVIGQSPNFGASAAKGSVVQITVSEGPGTATVSSVVGKGRLTAKSALSKAGLTDIETTISSPTVAVNHVISTNPGPGTAVPAGSSVAVVVSGGPQEAAVPSVVGKLQAAAQALIAQAGFTSTVTSVDSSQPPGTVVSQSPAAGSTRPAKSSAALSVAKAAKKTLT